MFTVILKLGQDYIKSRPRSPRCRRLSKLDLQSLQKELNRGLFLSILFIAVSQLLEQCLVYMGNDRHGVSSEQHTDFTLLSVLPQRRAVS